MSWEAGQWCFLRGSPVVAEPRGQVANEQCGKVEQQLDETEWRV